MMKLSIIIPAYNEEKCIGACLESVLRFKSPAVTEILVIDNASTDHTAAIAAGYPGVRVVSEPKKGLTSARQRGYLSMTGDVFCSIDADSHMTPQWCDTVERAVSEPDVICVSGMYDYYDLPVYQSWLIRILWRCIGGITYFFTSHLVVGGNFAVKKSALDAIGGFNTAIAFYGEDTDLGRRLHTVGSVRFLPHMKVITSGRRWTEEGFLRTFVRYGMNYAWEAIFGKPFTVTYRDVR